MDVNGDARTGGDRAPFLTDKEDLCVEPLGAGTDEALHAITMAMFVGDWHEGDYVQIANTPLLMLDFAWHVDIECSMCARGEPDGADLAMVGSSHTAGPPASEPALLLPRSWCRANEASLAPTVSVREADSS